MGEHELQEATDRVKYAENHATNCIPYIPRYIPVLKCTTCSGQVYEYVYTLPDKNPRRIIESYALQMLFICGLQLVS
jgi:hypothetical protein